MAVERVQAPNGGIALGSAGAAIPRDKALEIRNMLTHKPGRLVPRGPIEHVCQPWAGAEKDADGIWVFDETFMVNSGTEARHISSTGTVTNVGPTANQKISGRSVRLGAYAYAPSASPGTKLLRWPGGAVAPTELNNAPLNCTDVAVHLNRLFVAQGTTIKWSDLGGPVADTAAEWQDDTSGLDNQAVVGDDGDPIYAIISAGRQLLVFKANSVWTILGDTPSSFVVRQLTNSLGCIHKNSVIAIDDACVFTSGDGPVLYDGGFNRLHETWKTVLPGSAGAVSAVYIGLGYIVFTGGDSQSEWVLHFPSGAWSKATADEAVLTYGRFNWVTKSESGVPFAFDGVNFVHLGELTTERTVFGLDEGPSATTYPIPASWRTRLVDVGMPLAKAACRGVVVTHRTVGQDSDPRLPNWTAGLYDGGGTLMTTFTVAGVLATAVTDTAHVRTHSHFEYFGEIDDVYLQIDYAPDADPTDTPQPWLLELHDVWVEYQTAQRHK